MIYHYTSFENFINILKSKSLWLSSCMKMDDPIDKLYSIYCVSRYMSDPNNGINDKYFKDDDELNGLDVINVLKKNNFEYYSVSFGSSYDNEELWNKYANKNKGICLAIDDELLENHFKDLQIQNGTCYYAELSFIHIDYDYNKDKLLSEATHILEQEIEKITKKEFLDYFAYRMTGKIKSLEWKNQEEIRLLFVDDRKLIKRKLKKYKESNNFNAWKELDTISFDDTKKTLKMLGFSKKHKGHYALNLKPIWNNNIIPIIYVKDKDTYEKVKNIITNDTKLNNIKLIKL